MNQSRFLASFPNIISQARKTMVMVRNAVSFLAVAVAVLLMTMANATTYIVGDEHGWDSDIDYKAWAAGKSFKVGDVLWFKYVPFIHDVLLVSKEDYDSCTTTSPIHTEDSGSSTIKLSEGKRYFICGTAFGHCEENMKLEIKVFGSGLSPPSGESSPSPPGATSGSPPNAASPPPPGENSSSWQQKQPNSGYRSSSAGPVALTFALVMLSAI